MPDPLADLKAALAGRYTIERELGRGGMATVYLVHDLKHGRPVAVKVLRPDLAAALGPGRFLREIEIAARLTHPNILPLHESGEADRFLYYVMPYVEGESLRARLVRERQLRLDEALATARDVADALSYAHSHDVVHRDIKPENILLASDHALVADFGIARAITAAGGERLTETGLSVGTPGYMSPEQASGSSHLDGRSDQYSLACVVYEMFAGEPPYTGPTRQAIIAKQLTEPLPHLGTVRAVPRTVEAALTRALAKVPADRYLTVSGFAEALEQREPPATRWPVRATLVAGITLVALAAVIVGLNPGGLRDRLLSRSGTATAPGTLRRSVAVLGFKDLSGRPDEAWLSTALSEMLTTELAAGEQLRTIPGEAVAQMRINFSLPDADSYGSETLSRIRKSLGTDDVVLGSYVPLGGGQIRFDVRLQDTHAGETLTAVSEKGSEAHIDDLVRRVGTALRLRLGAGTLNPSTSAAVTAALPSTVRAARLYAEGLAKLRLFDPLGARELLEQAVAADPTHAPAHSALADAWWGLGYRARAREAARQAFELSTNLSREDRLSIEGRYREMTAQWDRAIEIYRALFAFFPDNLDYGLDLARVGTKAARPKDALSTAATLRSLPPPLRDDPRIDLAEADAAEALGDFKREKAAALRAAEKAELRGARLMLANARYVEAWALDHLGDLDGAATALEEARQIYASAGDRSGVGKVLNAMGTVSSGQGRLDGSAPNVARSCGDRRGNREQRWRGCRPAPDRKRAVPPGRSLRGKDDL